MSRLDEFVAVIKSEFPDDRLTWQKAIATFHPEMAEEAARLLKLANRHKQKVFITGFGNNIDPIGEPFVNMVSIRTDRLNQLTEITPENYFVTAGGGYPLRELNIHLARQGLFLPHAQLPYVGSVGGAVTVNLTGRLHDHDVPIKKYFIKTEVVTPEGEIVRPGSVCFKSVSGYDVVKIFAPSWGLLGLVVSATFRVLPTTAVEEWADFTQNDIGREAFLAGLDEADESADALYARKIKAKFDPNGILPVV